ncbi:MAG: hypothetical protein ACP5R2_12370 [Anaerolineae bacterium]
MSYRRVRTLLTFLVCCPILMLAACQSAPPEVTQPTNTMTVQAPEVSSFMSPLVFDSPLTTGTPYPTPSAPTPLPGRAAVRGGIISRLTGMPIADTSVYLIRGVGPNRDEMPPVWPGPVEGDVRGRTDMQGWFVFKDVPPGIYYMAVWAPLDYVVVERRENGLNKPLSLNVQADQILDLGLMAIYWP